MNGLLTGSRTELLSLLEIGLFLDGGDDFDKGPADFLGVFKMDGFPLHGGEIEKSPVGVAGSKIKCDVIDFCAY